MSAGFDDLLKKSGSLQASAASQDADRPAKKSKNDDSEAPFIESIANSLFYIWGTVNRNPNTSALPIDIARVEVEVRVGHIVRDYRRWKSQCSRKRVCLMTNQQRAQEKLSFKAGIDEIFVSHLRRILTNDRFSEETKPVQRLRLLEGGSRWEIDSNGDVLEVETKNRLYRQDVALLSQQYDIRIDAACEVPRNTIDSKGKYRAITGE